MEAAAAAAAAAAAEAAEAAAAEAAAAEAAAAAAAAEMRIRGHRVVRQEAKAGTHLQPVLLISLFVKTEAAKY